MSVCLLQLKDKCEHLRTCPCSEFCLPLVLMETTDLQRHVRVCVLDHIKSIPLQQADDVGQVVCVCMKVKIAENPVGLRLRWKCVIFIIHSLVSLFIKDEHGPDMLRPCPPTHTHTHMRSRMMLVESRCSRAWGARRGQRVSAIGSARENVSGLFLRVWPERVK